MESGTATAPPAPPPGRERETRPHHRLLFGAGALLFVCVFLPAVESCGDPVYPITFAQHPVGWPLLLPYAFGLAAAALAARRLWTPAADPRRYRVAAVVLGVACYGGLLVVSALMAFEEPLSSIPFLYCMLLFPAALRGLRRRAPGPWRAARAIWVGGATCSFYFGLFVVLPAIEGGGDDQDSVLVGVYLSLLASILLAAGGWLLERRVEPPPPPPAPPLPPARALDGR